MQNYFGTDGIRGKVGENVTPAVAYQLGSALSRPQALIVIGRDTRVSGPMLSSALSQGVYDWGGNCINIGVVPTNAVSHFVRKFNADFGVMVSASHNPPNYNGFKVFDRYGAKLCAQEELRISEVMSQRKVYFPKQQHEDRVYENIEKLYIDDLIELADCDLKGLDISIDCCFGSAFSVAPKLFRKAGAKVKSYCYFGRGDKINVECGATNPLFLGGLIDKNTPLAFAFDGDADRLAAFEEGVLLDNNKVFYCFAKYLKERGMLEKDLAVGTVLTNKGLEESFKKLGITLLRSDVGDTKMYRLMLERGASLAGEESGHYIFSKMSCSSDALLNALILCKIYREVGNLKEYSKELQLLPVYTKNIPLAKEQAAELAKKETYSRLNGAYAARYPSYRIIFRPSGTEPLARVFVEGEEEKAQEILAQAVSDLLEDGNF